MIHPALYDPVIRRALEEDLGEAGDITSAAVIDQAALASGHIVARRGGTLAGIEVAEATFRMVDANLATKPLAAEGEEVVAGAQVMKVKGSARSLLVAERTALNLLGHLSGIATATAALVKAVEGTDARIVDTRKTTPGLRTLEKFAVRMGGGFNHRFGPHDAVLIKDNHLLVAGGIRQAVAMVRDRLGHMVRPAVEVASLDQLAELLEVGADAVLLDNMDVSTMRRAVEMVGGRMVVEASGGITADNIGLVAETGVDLISVGWITRSAPALDVALDLG